MEDKKKGLECDQCGVISTCRASFEIHLSTHSGLKPYNCSICGKSFNRKGNCKRHELGHAGERPFECAVCMSRYTSKGSLMKHLQFHTGENLISCTLCSRKFTQNSHLKVHLRTHTGEKPFKCASCDKCFSLEYDLKMHQTVHEGKEMPCNICGKKFHHLGSLRGHMLRHSKKKTFKCPTCGIEFHAHCNLKVHMRIHTGERPFKCTICNKAFNRRARLRDHSLMHEKEKALQSSDSDKLDPSDTGLKGQTQPHNGDSCYCAVCHRRYANKYSLNQHMKVHADEPIQCLDCKKKFTSISYLKRHRENRACHIKKYSCYFCDRVFINKVNIIIHVRNTHADEEDSAEASSDGTEKLLKCSECSLCFSGERSRVWHEVCVHRLVEEIKSVKEDSDDADTVGSNRARINKNIRQRACNYVDIASDKSGDENSRDLDAERSSEIWNLFPENSIFIKEESVDKDNSYDTVDKDITASPIFEDSLSTERNHVIVDETEGDDVILVKNENQDDGITVKEEEYDSVIHEF